MSPARQGIALFCLLSASPLLSGCLAKTALDVVTAPVKVVGKTIDSATTSQSESDEKRGREMRERAEALGRLDRQYTQQRAKCAKGNRGACKKAREIYEQLEELAPGSREEPNSY